MPSRYDENTKARAVRLVREHRDDYDSQWAAMKAIAGRLGMNAETLRKWVRQAEIDAGEAVGISSEESRELRELRKKNHLGFGYGVHQCIGQNLARVEMQVAFATLARRLPG